MRILRGGITGLNSLRELLAAVETVAKGTSADVVVVLFPVVTGDSGTTQDLTVGNDVEYGGGREAVVPAPCACEEADKPEGTEVGGVDVDTDTESDEETARHEGIDDADPASDDGREAEPC